MAKKKRKGPGRPAGTPNLKSAFPRNENCGPYRVSQGFNKILEELITAGKFKSKADALHTALEILAARHLPADFFWMNKIQ